jgi:hypothetical protein
MFMILFTIIILVLSLISYVQLFFTLSNISRLNEGFGEEKISDKKPKINLLDRMVGSLK